jgi:hypothetical protein
MKSHNVTVPIPMIGLIAATRGMLGTGIGLLLASKMSEGRRRVVGRTLLTIGLASTIPLAMRVLRRKGTTALADQASLP